MPDKIHLEAEMKEKPWVVFVDDEKNHFRDFEVDSHDPTSVKIPDDVEDTAIFAYFDTAWVLEFFYGGVRYNVVTGRKDPHGPKPYYMNVQILDADDCRNHGYSSEIAETIEKYNYSAAILTIGGKLIEYVKPGEELSFMPGWEQ